MRLSAAQQIAEQKIRAFRRTDPAAAAAYALRFFGTCPMCGGTIRLPEEDIVTSIRHVHCYGCGWSAEITESQWRSAPEYGLKPACELALAEKAAARAGKRADFAPGSPERGDSLPPATIPRSAPLAAQAGERGASGEAQRGETPRRRGPKGSEGDGGISEPATE